MVQSIELEPTKRLIYGPDWSHLKPPDGSDPILKDIEKRYPYLDTEVSLTIRNLSLDDTMKLLEGTVGKPIPYRLEGSGFHPIDDFAVREMYAVDILRFLADLSGATLALEEGKIVFLKR